MAYNKLINSVYYALHRAVSIQCNGLLEWTTRGGGGGGGGGDKKLLLSQQFKYSMRLFEAKTLILLKCC